MAAKLLLGGVLKEGSPLSINPVVIWAWAGLLINAINSIPAGELDGGRIAFALFGRKLCIQMIYLCDLESHPNNACYIFNYLMGSHYINVCIYTIYLFINSYYENTLKNI